MRSIEYGSIQTQSIAMIKILEAVHELNPADLIFIIGEKGSGKLTLAQHIQKTVFKSQVVPLVRGINEFKASWTNGMYTVTTDQWPFIMPSLEDISYKMIHMPKLSDRKSDLLTLAEFFLQVLSLMNDKPKVKLTEKAIEKILQYGWPGQFYEFESILENAFSMAENGLIEPEYLLMGPLKADVDIPIGMKLEDLERKYILQTLYFVHQNRTRAAEILGISIRTLRNKINLYRVEGYL
ncbi:MAG: helix-turn-helix domain-containing protein [Pseudobdellovibrio sp.]